MGDSAVVNGVNLLSINDELVLHDMLDKAEEYEDRKKIRGRLKDVLAEHRFKREEIIRRREEDREGALRARVQGADEQKRRTLQMYDAMAKSAPAGGNKIMDVNILREGKKGAPGSPTTVEPHKVDLVDQAIRERQKAANERKALTLAAYDKAAKSGPAGSARFIDFDAVKKEDVENFESQKPFTSCFQMKGGIPIAAPAGSPIILPRQVEEEYDPMEAAIRKRQQACDEQKRRTLAAYDKAAKSRPAGTPISIYIPSCEGVEPVIEVANKTKEISPREKFQRMDSNSGSSANGTKPVVPAVSCSTNPFARPAAPTNVNRSPTAIKEMLLNWAKSKTKEYENIKIENFSTTWNDGMAFCALIHHFYPDAFDFSTLNPKNRRFNFDLAFKTAEEKGDVAPLLDTDDMVMMKKPDWKCVFCYVQALYRRFHNVD